MLHRVSAAVAILAVLGGFVLAETIRGNITKIDDATIEVTTKAKKGEKGEKKTIKINDKTKWAMKKGKDDEKDTTVAAVKKSLEKAKKGVSAVIETGDDGVATSVTVMAGKGKGKKKKDQ